MVRTALSVSGATSRRRVVNRRIDLRGQTVADGTVNLSRAVPDWRARESALSVLVRRIWLVTLELIDYRRGSADRYSWMPPFDPDVAYENSHWWDQVRYLEDRPWFVQVLDDGVEVARIELVEDGAVNPTYVGVPVIGDERLMIHLIEVAATVHRRKIGTQAVRRLEERHPGRRLFAYSEGADDFWDSLGWGRFTDPAKRSRPLYIQPAR